MVYVLADWATLLMQIIKLHFQGVLFVVYYLLLTVKNTVCLRIKVNLELQSKMVDKMFSFQLKRKYVAFFFF